MEKLALGQQRRSVWVANAGVAAHNTVHHLALLRTLPIFKRAELLIFLVGLNDLSATVAFEGASTQATFEQYAVGLMNHLLAHAPGSTRPYYSRLRLYTLARAATNKWTATSITHMDLRFLQKLRAEGTIVPLPNIQIGLRNIIRGLSGSPTSAGRSMRAASSSRSRHSGAATAWLLSWPAIARA
jgi:hypothetical protein